MSVYAGPEVTDNGLVFSYDMGNTDKSWKGAPSTNLLWANLSSSAIDIESHSTKTVISNNEVKFVNDGTGSSTIRLYVNDGLLVNGASYGVSLYVKDVIGTVYFDWCDTNPTGGVNSLSTSGRLYGIGTRNTYNSTYRFLDVYLPATTTVTISNAQVDSISTVTPFITPMTTRTNTQALLDPIGKNTITATSLTYASNNTFSFNGTSDYITPSNITDAMLNSDSWSLSCWIKFTTVNTGFDNTIASHGVPPAYGGALHLVERSGYLYFGLYGYDLNGARPVSAGIWYNVVFTYNYTSRLKTTYINGSYDNSYAHTVGYIGTGGNFKLGRAWESSIYYLNASMPSVQFYTKELSTTEVKQNFNALRGRFGI